MPKNQNGIKVKAKTKLRGCIRPFSIAISYKAFSLPDSVALVLHLVHRACSVCLPFSHFAYAKKH